jgi:TetR/AcrR family transcriptional regulator
MEQITLTRKEREKIRHKEEILHAALNLFSTKGFHNVSMQDVAAESEFAVGTLYNFFQSKEQLFTELLNDCAEKIYQILWPILQTQLPENEKIRAFIKAHIKLIEDNIEFIKFYVSEYGTLTTVPIVATEKAEKTKTELYVKLEETIKSGIRKNIFRCVDAKIATMSLSSTLQSFILESSKKFVKAEIKDGLAKIEHLFLDTLLLRENHNNG